jgi:hypothetical protein
MGKRKRDIKMNVNDDINDILNRIKCDVMQLVKNYNIKDISIFIDDGINLENFTGKKKLEEKISIELTI